jgi:hypothetical protein
MRLECIVGTGRSIGGCRGGELEPIRVGGIPAVAKEEELTLGRSVNLLGVDCRAYTRDR